MGCKVKYEKPIEAVDYNIKNLPVEKVLAMQDYARKLRKKFPHFSNERLARKVAEYFKINLTFTGALKAPAVPSNTPEIIKRY